MAEEIEFDETLLSKLQQVELLLEDYEKRIHLDKIKVIEPDLGITREILLSMHVEDLQGLAWEYAQYSLAIQRELNKHQSRYAWAEANLKRYLDREATQYSGWWQERHAEVMNGSEYAQRLNNLKIKSKLVIDRLSFIPSKVEFLSRLASDIMKTKRYNKVEHE